MGFLRGGPTSSDDRGIYIYVQSKKTGEKIRVRVDPFNDLVQEFEGGGDEVSHYTCHKDVMGAQSFEIIRLTLEFDLNRKVVGSTVHGGKLISEEEFYSESATGGAGSE